MSFDREHPFNKTLFTVIEDKELLKETMSRLEEIIGDMSQPGVGFMFTVPVGEVIGMSQLGVKASK